MLISGAAFGPYDPISARTVPFTEPAISELVVTSDGFVLAQTEGEIGANEMIGTEADLNRNLLDLVEAAGLSAEEIREFGRLQRKRIRRYSSQR